jgi:integrase
MSRAFSRDPQKAQQGATHCNRDVQWGKWKANVVRTGILIHPILIRHSNDWRQETSADLNTGGILMKRSGNESLQHLEWDEVPRLLAAITDAQDLLITRVTLAFGMRISETLELESTQISDGRILVCCKKGSARHSLPLSSGLLDVTAELQNVAMLRPGRRLFDRKQRTYDWRLKRYFAQAGLPKHKAHAHSLRHTACKRILELTGDVFSVQHYIGHRSLASSAVYLRMTHEDAAEKVQKYNGPALKYLASGA